MSKKVHIGAGIVAAAAAGAYFLFGTKEGKHTQTQIKGWMLKARGEVLDRMEDMKEVNEVKYTKLVDSILKKYTKLKKAETKEIAALKKDLMKHWKSIQKELKESDLLPNELVKTVKKVNKRKVAPKKKTTQKVLVKKKVTAKKTTKKTTKRSSKKK